MQQHTIAAAQEHRLVIADRGIALRCDNRAHHAGRYGFEDDDPRVVEHAVPRILILIDGVMEAATLDRADFAEFGNAASFSGSTVIERRDAAGFSLDGGNDGLLTARFGIRRRSGQLQSERQKERRKEGASPHSAIEPRSQVVSWFEHGFHDQPRTIVSGSLRPLGGRAVTST